MRFARFDTTTRQRYLRHHRHQNGTTVNNTRNVQAYRSAERTVRICRRQNVTHSTVTAQNSRLSNANSVINNGLYCISPSSISHGGRARYGTATSTESPHRPTRAAVKAQRTRYSAPEEQWVHAMGQEYGRTHHRWSSGTHGNGITVGPPVAFSPPSPPREKVMLAVYGVAVVERGQFVSRCASHATHCITASSVVSGRRTITHVGESRPLASIRHQLNIGYR